MATIKSYTDIEQSRKLAEILPIESADMRYTPFGDTHPWFLSNDLIEKDSTPCWSLSALLNILPTIDDRNAEFCKDIRYDKWHIYYHGTATLPVIDTDRYENLVDAVFEMIYWLKENKKI